MSRLTRLCRAVGVGLAVATAILSMTQVAHAQLPPPKIQPEAAIIKAPPANVVFLVGHVSKGVQTYTCDGAGNWGASVPTAELVDDSGKLIMTHAGGPTWTATADGSSVKGAVQQRVTIDQTAIPWLLLSATPVTGARTGLLTEATFIQRVNTTGGLAPAAADCTTKGQKADVPYGADYYFYRAAGKPSNPGKPGA
jgi:hypothetical protein